ncbi:oxidoreductase [Nocardioides sp. KC13]|uniref:Oxidoreductase n=2 Tax=Nocardioides turkmenicus TaxID=2711220 RepID=A0A6M1R1S8_9ACTN|nr:oxidoreductase [Nocardioides sp. KC13]
MLLSLYKPGGRTPLGRRAIERTRRARTEGAGSAEIAVVAEMTDIADGVRELRLRTVDGAELPAWEPGAHVDLVLPSGLVRQYSLCGDPADRTSYRVAVLREDAGRGGSVEIHGLEPGARIGLRGPRNHFPLATAAQHLFIAGGIGIAPFVPMVRELAARGEDWRLVYRGASIESMAYARELAADFPADVELVPADARPRPDLAALVAETAPGSAVYCCGPDSLIEATERAVAAAPGRTLRLERFTATDRSDLESRAFEVELSRTGQVVEVAENQTMLAAIQQVEPALDMSCEDGVCGSCVLRVLEGTPDHRDDVLQPDERTRTDVIYPCVSRVVGDRVVVDL